MIDDLKAIAIFVETIRQGSFNGAAKKLGLSAPSVSYNVAALEKRLGCALIYRTTRRLSLTDEGEQLFFHAKIMLESAERGIQSISDTHNYLRGKIRVTITTALLNSDISRSIAKFAQENPLVNMSINYTDQSENLYADSLDLAFRAGKLKDSTLKCKRLGEIERKLVCAKTYFDQMPPPKHPTDLEQWTWLNLMMMPKSRVLRKNQSSVTVTGHQQLSLNSVEAMTFFCRQGSGIATPPDHLVTKFIADNSLVELLPDWHVEPITFYALWPSNTSKNSLSKKLLSFIEDQCS